MALTDTWLRKHTGKPIDKEYEKTDHGGLSVRISPKGRITFQMRYRYNNTPKRIAIGIYPDLSLKAAREKHVSLREQLGEGKDPAKTILAKKHAFAKRADIDSLWAAFYDENLLKKVKDPGQHQRSYEIHIRPIYGRVLADDISIGAWLTTLRIIAADVPTIASRLLTDLRRMYSFGVRFKDVKTNPLADISAAYDLNIDKQEGDRTLSDDEIRLVLEAIKYTRNAEQVKSLVRLTFLFGSRVGELKITQRSWIANGIWTIPWQFHKVGKKVKRDLVRPVIPAIQPEIDRQAILSKHATLIFTRQDGVTPLQDRSHLDLPYSVQTWVKRQHGIKMDHFSVHDLRRTARTFFSQVTEPHVAEIMLGHTLPKVWRTYDKFYYLNEQKAAYTQWHDRLVGLGF